ncbi:MAG: ChaN family lipoprotein [Thiothrix sp.]
MLKPTHNHFLSRKAYRHGLQCCALIAGLIVGGVTAQAGMLPILKHETLADVLAYVQQHPPRALNAQQQLDFATLIAQLRSKHVVFVGEVHDRYDHHLNQLAILQALQQKNPNITIGVEWFQQPFQSVLDDYLAGKISEAELLQRSEYYSRWGYDYRQLRPIMEFAKTHKLPVLALNAPVELTRKVSQVGLIALTAAERAQLPATIHPADTAYRARLREVFAHHGDAHDKQQFERFVLVQRIWDETMAQNIVRHLQTNPERQMVVFAGTGHISHGAAIPSDVARQLPQVALATVASAETQDINPQLVDYCLPTQPLSLPASGRLGVLLDERDQALHIKTVEKGSAASKAGLQQGDRLASIDGVVVRNMADLKLALATHAPGAQVQVAVQRAGQAETLTYSVTLQ